MSLVLDLINKGLSLQLHWPRGGNPPDSLVTAEKDGVTPSRDNAFSCGWRLLLFPRCCLHPFLYHDPLSHQSTPPGPHGWHGLRSFREAPPSQGKGKSHQCWLSFASVPIGRLVATVGQTLGSWTLIAQAGSIPSK